MCARACAFGAVAAALPLLAACSTAAASSRPGPCDFGRPIKERALLHPRAGTFYARDVLNPDIVRMAGGYRMYFSGNRLATDDGYWHTGVAVSASPLGPFHVRRWKWGVLNGGTLRHGRRYFHAANVAVNGTSGPGRLYQSRDGRRWRRIADVPAPAVPAWDRYRSDLYLVKRRSGLDIYYAGRPGPSGADLGVLRYRRGRFGGSEQVLARSGGWDGLDLGEPAYFRARGREYLLYAGLAATGAPRRIGLAYRTGTGWRRCPRPLVDVSSRYPGNAIDPEPLVEHGRLYLYFGVGESSSLGGNMTGMIRVRVYRVRR